MDLSLEAKRNAIKIVRAMGGATKDAVPNLHEADVFWHGLRLDDCVFHRRIGQWLITFTPFLVKKQPSMTIGRLVSSKEKLSQCTQTQVLCFILGVDHPSLKDSAFDMTTVELIQRVTKLDPTCSCTLQRDGENSYDRKKLAELLPEVGELLTEELIEKVYLDDKEFDVLIRKYETPVGKTFDKTQIPINLFRHGAGHSLDLIARLGSLKLVAAGRQFTLGGIMKAVPIDPSAATEDERLASYIANAPHVLSNSQLERAVNALKEMGKPKYAAYLEKQINSASQSGKMKDKRVAQSTVKTAASPVQNESVVWRLAVRVLVPNAEQPRWQCELCGVASDDPSTILAPNGEAARRLNETQHQCLVAAIDNESNRVKDIWAPLARIVSPARSCEITVTELVDLLVRGVSELDEAGIPVSLPKELISGRESRVRKKCVVTEDVPRKPGTLKKDVILRFQVDLAVDGETLSPEELQELASIREPLVKVRGKWVYIDPAMKGELEKVVQEVLDHVIRSISEAEAVGMALTNEVQDASGANAIPSDFTFNAEGLQESLDSFRSGNPPEITLPTGLNATLRDYQRHGLNWLAMLGDYGLGACLADDMGLGKTLQTLAWLQHRKESGITEPALLICPTSVITNWEKEARRFTPKLRVFRQHGPNRPNDDLKFFARARKESTDLVITSFGTMCQDLELFQSVSWKWSAVILDEAQNIKNPSTTQSKAARSLSKYAASRLALTGTPVENGPRDLWPIMEFLNPGMLGTWPAYVKNFASPIENEKERNHREDLRAKIKPFILRRKKTDPGIAPELPDKIEQTVDCFLTREQAGWYQASLNNMKAALESKDKKERQGAILKVLQELKQACNGVAFLQKDRSHIYSRAGKITQLISMLAAVVENGEKAIVFSQYPSQFDELSELLMDRLTEHVKDTIGKPVGVLTLTGEHQIPEREVTQKMFAENDRVAVLLISLRAGGTGLNLQSANHVFHLDRWWNGAVEDQATDRVWRIGQKKMVHAHKFVCRGTLEERIDALITKKRNLASDLLSDTNEDSDAVVASVASQLAKLDADALYDVLKLDESEAVSDDET